MPDTTTLTLSFAANQLTGTWAAVDGISAYDFELLDADGLPVPGTPQYGLQATTAQVSGNLVANGLDHLWRDAAVQHHQSHRPDRLSAQ
jgi:hypothetical protein